MKACPFCAEDVQDAAILCKHCGADLAKNLPPARSVAPSAVVVQSTPALSSGIAAVLSLVIPGAGQMYCGHVLGGICWLVFVAVGYAAFIAPGFVLHLICIAAAASLATRENRRRGSVVTSVAGADRVAETRSASPTPSAPAASSDGGLAKTLGRAAAILVNPSATWRSNRTGAKVFLIVAYALMIAFAIRLVMEG